MRSKVTITRLSLCVGAAGMAVATVASAQSGAALLYPDLPTRSEAPILGVIPDVGPTAGIVLEVQSPTEKCSVDATRAAEGLMAAVDAVATCNTAIVSPITEVSELADTHVNRGVLLLTMQQHDDARRDFERALEINPGSAEALANRGAMRIAEGRPAEGVADLDRAIALSPERPERAYFSRAQGREDLKDFRGAYADYQMAQALKPDWAEPAVQLGRFRVNQRPAQ